jgi:hypothetical protein
VPAEDLENAVIMNLFSMFGDKIAIERAIENAFPNASEVPRIEDHLEMLIKELEKVDKRIENLVTAIARGSITESEVGKAMAHYREKKFALATEIDALEHKLGEIPAKKDIQDRARRMHQVVKMRALEHLYKSPEHFYNMPYENKRHLVEQAFAGPNTQGKRFGVYVRKTKGDTVEWTYSVKGILPEEYFGEVVGKLPMSKECEDDLLPKFNPKFDLSPQDFATHETKYALS